MRLLALDQSSRTTGYAIFEDQKLITQGTFTFTNNNPDLRLEQIRNKVISLIGEHQIDAVAIEDIQLESSVGNNVAVYKLLAEVIGVLVELFVELKINYEVIFPNTWRKQLSLWAPNRAACKKRAKDYVMKKYNLNVSEDTCDAICIGEAALTIMKPTGFDWS